MALRKASHCLNCNKRIRNYNYCPNCGQANTHKHVSTKQLIHDFFGDYFTFDSKFIHSLFPLVCKPGHLTREYTSGKRVLYILPLRLYLFTTFVFFFILSLNAKFDNTHFSNSGNVNIASSDSVKAAIKDELSELPEEEQKSVTQIFNFDFNEANDTENDSTNSAFVIDLPERSGFWGKIGDYFEKKTNYLSDMGSDGIAVFFKACINQFPKVLFFLLPIFALFLKLLYVRHKYFYIEHLIFALHSHTFFFIILTPCVLFPYKYIILPALILVYVYLFMAVKHFYAQSFRKTWFKLTLLLTLYSTMILPAMILLVLLAIVSV